MISIDVLVLRVICVETSFALALAFELVVVDGTELEAEYGLFHLLLWFVRLLLQMNKLMTEERSGKLSSPSFRRTTYEMVMYTNHCS